MYKLMHSVRGRSEGNFDDAFELPDPENPHFGANIFKDARVITV